MLNKNVHLHYQPEDMERPARKMSRAELDRFAAECCRYTKRQMANEKEYFIVG